jgi:hypothetical protein
MRVITLYCGECGDSSSECRFVCIGGCIASVKTWRVFEEEWRQVLDRSEIRVFKMDDFESHRGEFEKWKDKPNEHRAFLAQLITVLQKHLFVYFAASEPVYKTMDGKLVMRDDPYFDCLVAILDSALGYLESFEFDEKVQIVFADYAEHSSPARQLFPEARGRVGGLCDRLVSDAYGLLSDVVPLQPADLIAFEVRKERERLALRPRDQQRWPLTQLLTKPFYWNGYFRPPSPTP